MRLEGGQSSNEGRVEVCRLEQWQTVCNIGWDSTDASVVCRQLGFSRISEYNYNNHKSLLQKFCSYNNYVFIHFGTMKIKYSKTSLTQIPQIEC